MLERHSEAVFGWALASAAPLLVTSCLTGNILFPNFVLQFDVSSPDVQEEQRFKIHPVSRLRPKMLLCHAVHMFISAVKIR